MSTLFSMYKDVNGQNSFALNFSQSVDEGYQIILAATVISSFTVPGTNSDKYIVIFSYEPGSMVWISNNFTPTLPTGTLTATAAEMNPIARTVKGGDILQFISPDDSAEIGFRLLNMSY